MSTPTLSFAPILVAALVAIAAPLPAQLTGTVKWADSAQREIEAAFRTGDAGRLAAATALTERALIVTPNDPWLIYYRALGLYRTAGSQMGEQRNDDAKQVLEEADRILSALTEKQASADALALHGAVLNQLIGLSGNQMIAGMQRGPKSSELINRAMELAPENPRIWMIRGQSALFTPKMFGGGTDKALRDLAKAVELYAKSRQPTPPPLPDWGHADAYIWLGQALAKEGKRAEAKAAYLKALELAPGHPWVTRGLLPALERAKN